MNFMNLCCMFSSRVIRSNLLQAVVQKESQSCRLVCGSCDAEVGIVDDRAEGWRIWKWSVAIPFPRKVETFSIQKWISAHFLALIENQGVRKFSVRPDGEEESSLLVGLPLLNGFTRSRADSSCN